MLPLSAVIYSNPQCNVKLPQKPHSITVAVVFAVHPTDQFLHWKRSFDPSLAVWQCAPGQLIQGISKGTFEIQPFFLPLCAPSAATSPSPSSPSLRSFVNHLTTDNSPAMTFADYKPKLFRSSIRDKNDEIKRFIESLLDTASSDLEENVENIGNLAKYKSECRFIKKIVLAVSNMHKKQPPMTYSESVFNYTLLFPCLSATSSFLNDTNTVETYFTPGEEPLRAMVEQLTMINLKVDNRKSYKADGVIRSSKMNDLEVLLIETAGSFQSKDEYKISFDNIKGMFALLAMAKSIADYFSHASVETFGKLKLYYVQASDEYLRLWPIQYISNGICKYNREDKLKIRVDEPLQTAKELVDFFNA
ncbi:hypothetical protein MAM1_0266d08941 [Mucor ambiguus]|uniref:Uncharacterized protein n=1 Tax=Mucor ambiguus TaxID=91626 RepID=A0A0C9MPN0_9FUNG|nr:hypothetical protein MAM1_0266d08941 [Mucor ambiguus]